MPRPSARGTSHLVAYPQTPSDADGAWPPSLAVVGAKGGVGRSSLALNLAAAAGRTRSVLLVDANLPGGDLALLAGCAAPSPLAAASHSDPAPAEIVRAVPGVDLVQLHGENPHAPVTTGPTPRETVAGGWDWIVVDTGPGLDPYSTAAARAADDVLVVIAPELAAVADGYASLKSLLGERAGQRAACVVNMADSAAEAQRIQEGFAELARAFLGAQIDNRGYIPFNRDVREAAKGQTPFVLTLPSSPAAVAVADLATKLTERHRLVRQPTDQASLGGILRAFAESPSRCVSQQPVKARS